MNPQADILSDVLSSMRICGSLLLYEAHSPPWRLSIPDANALGILLGSKAGTRVIAFHLVERGYIEISLGDGDKSVVETGEMVICFGGNAHQISQGLNPPTVSIERLIKGEPNPFRNESQTRSPSVVCVCGVFMLYNTYLNPLFSALPSLLHTPVSQTGPFHNLSGVAALLAFELSRSAPGSSYMVERLLELLCAEAVRSYIERLQPGQSGWLTGLKDPVVNRVLAMIHAKPGADWSVSSLAQGVAMSPSRLAARFTASLGESPMSYVAKWRMNLASRLLNNTEKTINEIATEVGYESLAAFNRAFKRHLSVPPGAWRARTP